MPDLADSFNAYVDELEQDLLLARQQEQQWRQQALDLSLQQLSQEEARTLLLSFAKYAETPTDLFNLVSAIKLLEE